MPYILFDGTTGPRYVGEDDFEQWAGGGDLAHKMAQAEQEDRKAARELAREYPFSLSCENAYQYIFNVRTTLKLRSAEIAKMWCEAVVSKYGIEELELAIDRLRLNSYRKNKGEIMTEEEERKQIIADHTARAKKSIDDAVAQINATPEDFEDLRLVESRRNEPTRPFEEVMSEIESENKLRSRRHYIVQEIVKTFAVFVLGYIFGTILAANGVHW